MRNLALIGMMGSGKTTLGKMLSEKMCLDYCCSDDYIENKQKRSISEIFEKDGEDYFRKIEIEAIQEISQKNNIVVATGGGIVLNKENMDNLRKNGFIIIFLNRNINKILEDISIENRPLIKDDVHKLEKIFNNREFLYKKYSDIIINNQDCLNQTLDKLFNILASVSSVEYDQLNNRRIVYY